MTQPLTHEIAAKYGFSPSMGVGGMNWAKNYVNSLKVKERMHQIKPIKQFSLKVGMPLWNHEKSLYLTEEIRKYVLDIKKGESNNSDSFLILNPNYIYILKHKGSDVSYYIPIGIPFNKNTRFDSTQMRGIYNFKKGVSYTNKGFNLLNYEIIGILNFSSQVKFINWQENPLGVKE